MMRRGLVISLALTVAVAAGFFLLVPVHQPDGDWQQRKLEFEAAITEAEPLIAAITAYSAAAGQPPERISELAPGYLERLPVPGLKQCRDFEYRSLAHKQAALAWYDLGSRQGQPYAGQSRYSVGQPGNAVLVFTLGGNDKISGAHIDRSPKDVEMLEFDPAAWKARQQRIPMAPALAERYRLYGMPRTVFESLLGAPDGYRVLDTAPWELRISCPTGLLNANALVYWPTEDYPERLYGGLTERLGRWVYVRQ